MNVYDFDGTLYNGESGTDFYKFCLKRRYRLFIYWPVQAWAWIGKHLLNRNNTWMKQRYYAFFKGIDALEMAEKFWDANADRIFEWYGKVQKDDDLVITASPEFLIRPICDRLGIKNLIASEVDHKTGKTLSANCRDREKVVRYRREYGDTEIENFYSDSYADTPLAELAQKAYMIKDGEVTDWDFSATPDDWADTGF